MKTRLASPRDPQKPREIQPPRTSSIGHQRCTRPDLELAHQGDPFAFAFAFPAPPAPACAPLPIPIPLPNALSRLRISSISGCWASRWCFAPAYPAEPLPALSRPVYVRVCVSVRSSTCPIDIDGDAFAFRFMLAFKSGLESALELVDSLRPAASPASTPIPIPTPNPKPNRPAPSSRGVSGIDDKPEPTDEDEWMVASEGRDDDASVELSVRACMSLSLSLSRAPGLGERDSKNDSEEEGDVNAGDVSSSSWCSCSSCSPRPTSPAVRADTVAAGCLANDDGAGMTGELVLRAAFCLAVAVEGPGPVGWALDASAPSCGIPGLDGFGTVFDRLVRVFVCVLVEVPAGGSMLPCCCCC